MMAKDVARIDRKINQTYAVQSQLRSIEGQISTAMTTNEIAGIVGISASTLAQVNETMDIASITQVAKEFAKNSEKVEMKSEMMGDALDMIADPALEGDADEVYKQVLDE